MRDLLVVLNPRRIPRCIDALEQLPVDKLWLTNRTEAEIADLWPELFHLDSAHDRWIVVSDDVIVTAHALDAVRALLDDGHPVATGYCNLDQAAHAHLVNITSAPLADTPHVGAYLWRERAAVEAWLDPAVPTWFAGMCLTGMTRTMWQEYPFQVWDPPPGRSSDFMLSKRLQDDGVPIVAARDGFVEHVKERWNHLDQADDHRLLVGVRPAATTLDEAA